MGKFFKGIILIAAILFILLIGGCAIATFSVGKSLDDSAKSGKAATASMSQVRLGMTRAQVEAILGKPDSDQSMTSSYDTSSCIYYGTLSDDDWQLCFTNGSLDSKNRY
jgi:outer membrane protein assembly factor BamE (lipoprotein component of BamABCDE complex)